MMRVLRGFILTLIAFAGALFAGRYFAYGEKPDQAWRNVTVSMLGAERATKVIGAANVAAVPASASADAPAPNGKPALAPPDGPPIRVLFIGNSLTHFIEMPKTVERMAWSEGINLRVDMHAPGGWYLAQQAVAPPVVQKLAAGGWDAVVLQEQSQLPAFMPDQVRQQMFPAARLLADQVRRGSPNARLILYMTPAARNGDPQNTFNIPELATYAGMQARVNRSYDELAGVLQATVARVGPAWQAVREAGPNVNLYSDDRHPNPAGAYLIACVFYRTLTGRSPVGNTYYGEVDPPTAQWLQRMSVR